MAFFETNAIGRIINRFSGDTQAIDDRISFESNCLLNNVFILAGGLIVIILQNLYIFISG
jgi:ABC-type multidrug transport system fused ATPase/permease subunit